MAPDLNSVPPSSCGGRHLTTSTRSPDPMPPSLQPSSLTGSNPPVPVSREISESAASSTSLPPRDNTGVGLGPGPLRHPRPLTAADLHMQLEKEQEAVVNRLTRELSILRQQSASVASTTSSASTGFAESTDHNGNHPLLGANRVTPSRRHRSSSSLSTRSVNTAATTTSALTGNSGSTVGTTAGVAGSIASGVAPARDINPYHQSLSREPLSRHNSVTSSRRSEASSPSLSSSLLQGDHFPTLYAHRSSASSQQTHNPQNASPSSARSSYLPSLPATARYEEIALHRSELELVKRENDALRRRIQELERSLRNRRQPDVGRSRSGSTSTSASMPQMTHSSRQEQSHSTDDDDDNDMVNVGESAGSIGFGGGH